MEAISLSVYCIDIGSIRNHKFGWARICADMRSMDTDVESLVTKIVSDLQQRRVAIGFECPLFVPLHTRANDVLCCRHGEGNRSWSASAGIASLGAGLVEAAWLLTGILRRLSEPLPVYTDISRFQCAEEGLLLWEAFVTGKRTSTHQEDALLAAEAFLEDWPTVKDTMPSNVPILSLIGTVLLRTGWSRDLDLLMKKPVVVQPNKRCSIGNQKVDL